MASPFVHSISVARERKWRAQILNHHKKLLKELQETKLAEKLQTPFITNMKTSVPTLKKRVDSDLAIIRIKELEAAYEPLLQTLCKD
jgi:hypothetical protein